MGLVPVGITALDKLTIGSLDRTIENLKAKKKEEGVSDKTAEKVDSLITKYQTQKNKTLALYNKNKTNKNKNKLAGVKASTLSVEKIYNLIGQKTKDNSQKNGFAQWFGEHPVENTLLMVGAATMLGSALTSNVAQPLIKETLKFIWEKVLGTNTGWFVMGGLLVAGVLASKLIRKKMQEKAGLETEAILKAEEGTVKDHDHLVELQDFDPEKPPKEEDFGEDKEGYKAAKADYDRKKAAWDALVEEAAHDPETMAILESISINPLTGKNMDVAMEIIKAAKEQGRIDEAKAKENFQHSQDHVVEKIVSSNQPINKVPNSKVDVKKKPLPVTQNLIAAEKLTRLEGLSAKAGAKISTAEEVGLSAVEMDDPHKNAIANAEAEKEKLQGVLDSAEADEEKAKETLESKQEALKNAITKNSKVVENHTTFYKTTIVDGIRAIDEELKKPEVIGDTKKYNDLQQKRNYLLEQKKYYDKYMDAFNPETVSVEQAKIDEATARLAEIDSELTKLLAGRKIDEVLKNKKDPDYAKVRKLVSEKQFLTAFVEVSQSKNAVKTATVEHQKAQQATQKAREDLEMAKEAHKKAIAEGNTYLATSYKSPAAQELASADKTNIAEIIKKYPDAKAFIAVVETEMKTLGATEGLSDIQKEHLTSLFEKKQAQAQLLGEKGVSVNDDFTIAEVDSKTPKQIREAEEESLFAVGVQAGLFTADQVRTARKDPKTKEALLKIMQQHEAGIKKGIEEAERVSETVKEA